MNAVDDKGREGDGTRGRVTKREIKLKIKKGNGGGKKVDKANSRGKRGGESEARREGEVAWYTTRIG